MESRELLTSPARGDVPGAVEPAVGHHQEGVYHVGDVDEVPALFACPVDRYRQTFAQPLCEDRHDPTFEVRALTGTVDVGLAMA